MSESLDAFINMNTPVRQVRNKREVVAKKVWPVKFKARKTIRAMVLGVDGRDAEKREFAIWCASRVSKFTTVEAYGEYAIMVATGYAAGKYNWSSVVDADRICKGAAREHNAYFKKTASPLIAATYHAIMSAKMLVHVCIHPRDRSGAELLISANTSVLSAADHAVKSLKYKYGDELEKLEREAQEAEFLRVFGHLDSKITKPKGNTFEETMAIGEDHFYPNTLGG